MSRLDASILSTAPADRTHSASPASRATPTTSCTRNDPPSSSNRNLVADEASFMLTTPRVSTGVSPASNHLSHEV